MQLGERNLNNYFLLRFRLFGWHGIFSKLSYFVVQHFSLAVNIFKKFQKHPDLLKIEVFSWWRLLDSNQ